MIKRPHLTRCGLPGIDRIPYGWHACHFYRNREQLAALLVPYFLQGLRENERCIWITAPPLRAGEAARALRASWSGVDDEVQAGALRILDFDHWYASAAGLKGVDVVRSWLEEEERALAEGYNGLRIAGNTSFVTTGDWPSFMAYEQAVSAEFAGRHVVALCSYATAHSSHRQIGQIVGAHHCSLEGPDAYGQVLPIAEFPRCENRP